MHKIQSSLNIQVQFSDVALSQQFITLHLTHTLLQDNVGQPKREILLEKAVPREVSLAVTVTSVTLF